MSGPEQHRQAYAYCAYCPKVCRFSCPVSDSTHNETTSTWGKMTQAFLAETGKRPLTEDSAAALYACTGCMRCRSFCKHENEVGFALFEARQMAQDTQQAPRGALTTRKTFEEHGNPFGRDLASDVAAFQPEGPVLFSLFPGCTSLVKRRELVEDAMAVSAAFAAPLGVCKASNKCCGYPLYAAGDQVGFRAHAEKMAEALEPYSDLVVLDPGCAYTLKVVYPRAGVTLKNDVRTLYEVLAERLEHAPVREKLEARVAYQDACHLGRGLGQYEEPRRLLAAAVNGFRESQENRAEAGCSGGGGLLPRTMAETSVDIARREAQRVAPEGETVVTACPTSRRMFERAGKPTEDLLSVLRRWLNA
ncbi:MAG TPA: (Fe-S)-binding protein [Myxococcaceae bacterium]|nr:(Fe-S)-binding protein [Myxococcaceae bacterium]